MLILSHYFLNLEFPFKYGTIAWDMTGDKPTLIWNAHYTHTQHCVVLRATHWWGCWQVPVHSTVCSATPPTSCPSAHDAQRNWWNSAALERSWNTAVDRAQSNPKFRQFSACTTRSYDISSTRIRHNQLNDLSCYTHYITDMNECVVFKQHIET